MCDTHRGYKAVRKPRVECIDCWFEWIEKHPDYSMEAKDIKSVVTALLKENNALRKEVNAASQGARFAANLASRGAF